MSDDIYDEDYDVTPVDSGHVRTDDWTPGEIQDDEVTNHDS